VERGQANKRRGLSIRLTRDRLVAVDRPEESPASGGGGQRRRSSGGAPAVTRTAVREGAGLNHVLHRELPCDPGKALGRSPGLEKRRRGELDGGGPAAAAGTRVPANVWLSLIDKRLGEILWCTERSLGAWVREDGDRKRVHTERRQWRAAARGKVRVRAGSDRGGFIWALEVG
jgi:hypothetical protein